MKNMKDNAFAFWSGAFIFGLIIGFFIYICKNSQINNLQHQAFQLGYAKYSITDTNFGTVEFTWITNK